MQSYITNKKTYPKFYILFEIYINPQIADNPKFVIESNNEDNFDISLSDILIEANLKNPSQSDIETQQINEIDNEHISRDKNNSLHGRGKTEASQANEKHMVSEEE